MQKQIKHALVGWRDSCVVQYWFIFQRALINSQHNCLKPLIYRIEALFWPSWAFIHVVQKHTCRGKKNIHIKKRNKPFKNILQELYYPNYSIEVAKYVNTLLLIFFTWIFC